MNALMRRFDEFGMRTQADAVFVPDEALAAEVREAGVAAADVVVGTSVEQHLAVYRGFLAERGHE